MREDERLRAAIESTLLAPGTRWIEVERLLDEALTLGVVGACFPPRFVQRARLYAEEQDLRIVTVANFPLSYSIPDVVAHEIVSAAAAGANEVDVVAPLGLALAGDWDAYESDLRLYADAATEGGVPLKCILETAALDSDQLRRAAECACAVGVRWLKTSTGFHPSGGASPRAVQMLREIAPPDIGVKASGGIRDRKTAEAMLAAGADRIGTSAAAAILADA